MNDDASTSGSSRVTEMATTEASIGRRLTRIERRLDLVLHRLGIVIDMEEHAMSSAAGEALEAAIDQLDVDVAADNAAVVKGGEAIAAATTEFSALKAEIEGLQANEPLTQEQIEALTAKATASDTQLEAASTSLTEHVSSLEAGTAAA